MLAGYDKWSVYCGPAQYVYIWAKAKNTTTAILYSQVSSVLIDKLIVNNQSSKKTKLTFCFHLGKSFN